MRLVDRAMRRAAGLAGSARSDRTPPRPASSPAWSAGGRARTVQLVVQAYAGIMVCQALVQLPFSPRPLSVRLFAAAALLMTPAIAKFRDSSSTAIWGWLVLLEAVAVASTTLALAAPERAIALLFGVAAHQSLTAGSTRRALAAVGAALAGYLSALAWLGVAGGDLVDAGATLGFLPGLVVTALSLRFLLEAVHERIRIAGEARQTSAQLGTLIETSPVGLVHLDASGTIRLINSAAERILGISARYLLGTKPAARPRVSSQAMELMDRLLSGPPLRDVEFRLDSPDRPGGQDGPRADRHLSVSSAPVHNEGGDDGVMIVFTDVTERARLEEELSRRALYDELTGLANRALFTDRAEHALRTVPADRTIAVLVLDLDRFKVVNDALGHATGDRLLQAVAERLRECTAATDTISRFGGDEFAILLEAATPELALDTAHRVVAALADPVLVDGHALPVRSSVGVAVLDPTAPSAVPDLIRDADAAMYAAKRGGGGVSLFHSGMRAAALERMQFEADLRRGIGSGELVVHYQPEMDLVTGSVTGVEALVRWQHPSRGLLLPNSFIPLAEETGLIVPLGRAVLNEACTALRRWLRAWPHADLHVAVNVSVAQLRAPGFVDDVRQILAHSGLPPQRLVLEVTESLFADGSASPILRRLKELGVGLALDDFGTGYSALSYLQAFPLDVLKIDQSFVSRLGAGPRAAALARSVIDLAHALGMVTVGEGVETSLQAGLLRDLGCGLAQGFHFARPTPAAGVEALLRAQESSPSRLRARSDPGELTRSA